MPLVIGLPAAPVIGMKIIHCIAAYHPAISPMPGERLGAGIAWRAQGLTNCNSTEGYHARNVEIAFRHVAQFRWDASTPLVTE